jgi:hypothetical protein
VIVRFVPPFGFRVKSTPVPVSGSACGEFGALSLTVKVPALGPPAVGTNAICRVQAVFTATVAPQVLLPGRMMKSPVIAIF